MTFKDQVEARAAEFERQDQGAFRGSDWCELSPEEEIVFGIDRGRFPRILAAWMAYQCLAGIVAPADHGFDAALVEAERLDMAGLVDGELSEDAFTKAAMKLAGLTTRECHAMWCKTDFHGVRHEGVRFADET